MCQSGVPDLGGPCLHSLNAVAAVLSGVHAVADAWGSRHPRTLLTAHPAFVRPLLAATSLGRHLDGGSAALGPDPAVSATTASFAVLGFLAFVAWSRLHAGAAGPFELATGAALGVLVGALVWSGTAERVPQAFANAADAIAAAALTLAALGTAAFDTLAEAAASVILGAVTVPSSPQARGETPPNTGMAGAAASPRPPLADALEALLPVLALAAAAVSFPSPFRFVRSVPNAIAAAAAVAALLAATSPAGLIHVVGPALTPYVFRGHACRPPRERLRDGSAASGASRSPGRARSLTLQAGNRTCPGCWASETYGPAEPWVPSRSDLGLVVGPWGGERGLAPIAGPAGGERGGDVPASVPGGRVITVVADALPSQGRALCRLWGLPDGTGVAGWALIQPESGDDEDDEDDEEDSGSAQAGADHAPAGGATPRPSVSAEPSDRLALLVAPSAVRALQLEVPDEWEWLSVSLSAAFALSWSVASLFCVGSTVRSVSLAVSPSRETRVRLFEPRYTPTLCRTLRLCATFDDVAWSIATWGGATVASVPRSRAATRCLAAAESLLLGLAPGTSDAAFLANASRVPSGEAEAGEGAPERRGAQAAGGETAAAAPSAASDATAGRETAATTPVAPGTGPAPNTGAGPHGAGESAAAETAASIWAPRDLTVRSAAEAATAAATAAAAAALPARPPDPGSPHPSMGRPSDVSSPLEDRRSAPGPLLFAHEVTSATWGMGSWLPRGVRIGQRLSDIGHVVVLASAAFETVEPHAKSAAGAGADGGGTGAGGGSGGGSGGGGRGGGTVRRRRQIRPRTGTGLAASGAKRLRGAARRGAAAKGATSGAASADGADGARPDGSSRRPDGAQQSPDGSSFSVELSMMVDSTGAPLDEVARRGAKKNNRPWWWINAARRGEAMGLGRAIPADDEHEDALTIVVRTARIHSSERQARQVGRAGAKAALRAAEGDESLRKHLARVSERAGSLRGADVAELWTGVTSLLGAKAGRAVVLASSDGLRFNVEVPTAIWAGLALGLASWTVVPVVLVWLGHLQPV